MTRLFACFLLLYAATLGAQAITGVVVDETQQPLPGASVYLDGTSVLAITRSDGTFALTAASRINTSLVVSMVGFETLRVDDPFANPKYRLVMKPRTMQLEDVVIGNDEFTRKQKMDAFLREFLGDTKAGRSCTIQNPDDISLRYDKQKHRLTATADTPIRIVNAHLGYEVTFQLMDFYVDFSHKSLKKEHTRRSFFAGTSNFAPLAGDSEKYRKNRSKSFLGSATHFFRDLCRNHWGKDGFVLYDGSFPADATAHFEIVPREEGFAVRLLTPRKFQVNAVDAPQIYRKFNLLYRKRDQSGVVFHTEEFAVDRFGNHGIAYAVEYSGDMAVRRVGDMLPLDYEQPEDTK